MRRFTNKQPRFPADMLQLLDLFGRSELSVHTSGIDTSDFIQRVMVAYYEYSQSDPDGFLADLRAVVAGDEGGFATYGAARLVWEYYGEESLRMPAAAPLVDAGIDFKVARNLPGMMFAPYEQWRLDERRAGSA